MICPSCQAENRDGVKFCTECGTALALRCPSCGAPHAPAEKFCGECGFALSAAPAAPAAPTPPVPSLPEPTVTGPTELRLVSVLFVDLVGFTSLSESRDAEDVRELLGRYFETARTIVERYGGTIEKFIGDAVMAVWGVPVAREDDAERAVRAALDVVDAVAVFGTEVGATDLRARAGVVTGQVAALENPGEGLVVGDRVNTASRVQSAAAPGTVLADEVTRQTTSASIAYEDAGEHSVKGKAEPIRLWRAVRVVAGVAGSQREEGIEAPFVGRDGDLRLLKELFHSAQERRSARLVAVSGEAGVGKSRLRREFFQYIDGLAGTVLWHSGRCLSYGEGVAYWALAEMVRQRFGITEDASNDEVRAKLTAGLERWVSEPSDREFLAPRLGALLGVGAGSLAREELFGGWRMFFERLAEHEPVALVFEDLHWADDGLLDFIGQLLDWSAGSPIFILTLARPELAERHQGWPAGRRGATVLGIEPLEDGAMQELLAGLVDGLPRAATDRIVAQAEGIPLYAVETVRALADRGVLAAGDGRLVPVREVGELDVPASLGSLLAARLDALEPEERQLVKAMSVFGGSFPRAAAAVLGDVEEAALDRILDGLVRKQVLAIRADRLSPDQGQYAFTQGLLRTVAYETLSRQERKARHLAAAEHLRRAFADDGEDVAEVIGTHYLDAYRAAAGDSDEEDLRVTTVQALRRAAHRADTVGAPDAAERTYRTAAELTTAEREGAELREAAAEMALQSGAREEALELFEQVVLAHRTAGRAHDAARVTARVARALVRAGRGQEAPELLERTLAELDEDAPPELVAALNGELGYALVMSGRSAEAAEAIEIALQLAAAHELPRVLSRSLTTKAIMYDIAGRAEEASALYDGALRLAERHALDEELSHASGNAANLRLQWDLPGAAEQFGADLARHRRRGDRYREAHALGNRLQLHLLAGRWDEIDRIAAELFDDTEERPFEEYLRVPVGFVQALRGQLEPARLSVERLAAWADTDNPELRHMRAALVVCVGVAEGSPDTVVETGRAMITDAIATDGVASDGVRLGWPTVLDAALACERTDVARELVALLQERPIGHLPPYFRAHLARGRARCSAAGGDHETVEADLARALEIFRTLAYPYWLAVTQVDLAEWLIGQGRPVEAEPLLEEAIAALETLGAAPALTRARSLRPSPSAAVSA